MKRKASFTAKVDRFPMEAAWYFVRVPSELVPELPKGTPHGAWGMRKVRATLGTTSWDTMIAPMKKAGPYFLPLKAAVRKKEGVLLGESVTVSFIFL